MRKDKQYESGLSWGEKTFKKNVAELGETGIAVCDKSARTCMKYATDLTVKTTSKGKLLTPELRRYYQGIADGMLSGYNKLR